MKTTVPGTCGEWVQGFFDGEPVLISCPIERYSHASIAISQDPISHVDPQLCRKALQAVMISQEKMGCANGYRISLDSQLPVSRGYGSSTADIVVASAALHQTNGIIPSPASLASLACSIEPSDSTMFPGWSLFAYRSGKWHRYLGQAIRIPLLILDPGIDVDTVIYNQKLDLAAVKMLEIGTIEAIELFRQGIRNCDISLLGRAASMSALNYQRVFHSELVDEAADWMSRIHACGMVRAHSGSIVGMIFEKEELMQTARDWLVERFVGKIIATHTTGGGVRYITCQKSS